MDAAREEVLDYKTATGPGQELLEDEARQLRLYAHLAITNGMPIKRGVVLRANRVRATTDISTGEAAEEARLALATLDELNGGVGRPFRDLASPSEQACARCQCIPLCESFWTQATPEWGEAVGLHMEGKVREVREIATGLVGIDLDSERGTVPPGPSHLERLTRRWLTAAGGQMPRVGQTIRATDLYAVDTTQEPVVYRAQRESTHVWVLD